MSKLDLAKEQIAYLKLWLGIMVAVGMAGSSQISIQLISFSCWLTSQP
jgi:hypothetical protein